MRILNLILVKVISPLHKPLFLLKEPLPPTCLLLPPNFKSSPLLFLPQHQNQTMGAVQFGIFAACVVLFLPMGMAGWHLSRNKMLFFSGALFITLAVGVHLTPYFPSLADVAAAISFSAPISQDRDSCISYLHDLVWLQNLPGVNDFSSNSSDYRQFWSWDDSRPIIACGFSKLGRVDTSDLLNGSWVVVAGDSQARLFVQALLSLMLDSAAMESVRGDLFKRHSNYRIAIQENGARLDFIWAPYPANLTGFAMALQREQQYPDVLVMGSGLWHMLHFTDASDFGASLGLLRRSVVSLLPIVPNDRSDGPAETGGAPSVQSPHMFWLGMPLLINSMLNTEEKKEKMTEPICSAYDHELLESKLLRGSGGPFMLLNVRSLTRGCGLQCTADGMHYSRVVYEAAVHIMLNALLIESRQQI
ncbi:hypothetical protein ACLOJK_009487 [Asimina triloba]